jgi:YggT family protein
MVLVPLITAFMFVFNTAVDLYSLVIFLAVVASWLIPMGVLDMRNQMARSIVSILYALTDPVFRRVRRFIPPIAGLDLSPIILLVALQVLKVLVNGYIWMLV